ncbi:MAG: class I SAM-dependent methyltransferase [Methanobacteriaceae archaeon]|nr:class I SAM-dependent methyltransferase [Methanobacteriaceae archaeon]
MIKGLLKKNSVKRVNEYDKYRELIIPNYEIFYGTLVEQSHINKTHPMILDLGAGTGLLSQYLQKKYPEGKFILIDLSEDMLSIAKKRFKGKQNFEYISNNYLTYNFEKSFDLIVSSLSIHHLTDQEKFQLYQKVYNLLNKDGIFLNADLIRGNTAFNEHNYQNNWMNKIENVDMEESYKKIAIERMELDQPATLEENLKWLEISGFNDIDIYYKYYNFVVLFGRK